MSARNSSVLTDLKAKLSPLAVTLLKDFWDTFFLTDQWPLLRNIHSKYDKAKVREALLPLGGAVVYEVEDGNTGNRYALGVLGALLTAKGATYRKWYLGYFELLRRTYLNDPMKRQFTAQEIQTALKLSDTDLTAFDSLSTLRPLYERTNLSVEVWGMRQPDDVEDFPREGPLDTTFEDFLLKRIPLSAPVFRADLPATKPVMFIDNFGQSFTPASAPPAGSVDVLKRRYQVFVSSTYDDLRLERQQVIQALLETKCFPTGMELFPASSFDQMELIKRLIDVCDYYVVIVAGRYGSLGKEGLSYTEMEFDYARQLNKPIIGFYHRSVGEIKGEKIEPSDQGKAQLAAFAAKVKSRTCRAYSTPEELGSAVKSAILNELEFNPQPGWIRADAVPSSDLMDKLKQKVADLEEQLKRRASSSTTARPEAPKIYDVEATLDYHPPNPVGKKAGREAQYLTEEIKLTRTLEQVLVALARDLEQPCLLEDLSGTWSSSLASEGLQAMAKRLGGTCEFRDCRIDYRQFDGFVNSLTAKKFIRKDLPRSQHSGGPFYRLTPAGVQRVAELKAV